MHLDLQIPEEFVSETALYDYKTSINSIMGKMKAFGTVIITRDNKYIGILDDKSLAKKDFSRLTNISAGKLARKLPLLGPKTSMESAIGYFYNSEARALPFVSDKKIKGVVKREKILEAILSLHVLSKVKVSSIMTSPVLAIGYKASIAEAISVMRQKQTDRLLVVVNSKPAGILTQRDMELSFAKPEERLPAMKDSAHGLEEMEVGSAAEMYLYSVKFDDNVDSAIKELIKHNISSLAVTRDSKTIGILTARDILKSIALNQNKQLVPIDISGLDTETKEYEQEIIDSVSKAIDKIAKFTKLEASEAELTVSKSKNNYEIRANVVLARGKEISASSSAYSLDSAVKQICDRLYKLAREKKELGVSRKKEGERYYAE